MQRPVIVADALVDAYTLAWLSFTVTFAVMIILFAGP